MTNQPPALPFNMSTRQSIQYLQPMQYVANQPVSQQITQVGLLARIYVPVSVTLNTNSSGTYTLNGGTNPAPYSLFQRIRVLSNEGSELYSTTGIGQYLVNRVRRSQFDIRNPAPSLSSSNTAAAIFNVPSSLATSSSTTINFMLDIPVAYTDQLQAGLVLIQNPTTRLQLELTFGNAVTDLYTAAGGGVITVSNVSITPEMEYYNLPTDTRSYPDLSMVYATREEITSINNTGEYQYKPPLGNTFVNVLQQFENNGARMLPNDFSNIKFIYSASQVAYNYNVASFLYRQRYMLGGIDLPDGVFWWAFGNSVGLPEIAGSRDLVDTGRLTDLAITPTIASTVTLVNAQVRTIRQELVQLAT